MKHPHSNLYCERRCQKDSSDSNKNENVLWLWTRVSCHFTLRAQKYQTTKHKASVKKQSPQNFGVCNCVVMFGMKWTPNDYPSLNHVGWKMLIWWHFFPFVNPQINKINLINLILLQVMERNHGFRLLNGRNELHGRKIISFVYVMLDFEASFSVYD